ncbi:MAG TPA: hypothetical protein VLH56_02420 [Dissulfurispiraceae bacterium]|nr:hypothetical protein [Dissulfurispiraceae bacterium]
MNEMHLYKLLQQHVGRINDLVIALYQEKMSAEEAEPIAKEELEKTLTEIIT